jgi:hypothetical protein
MTSATLKIEKQYNKSDFDKGRDEAALSIAEGSEVFFISKARNNGALSEQEVDGWNSMVFSKENRDLQYARKLGFF